MGLLSFTLKHGTRYGVVGGSVYYTNHLGVWSTAESSEKLVNQAKVEYKKTPVKELDDLVQRIPTTGVVTTAIRTQWNRAVRWTINAVMPHSMEAYCQSAWQTAQVTYDKVMQAK